MKTFDAPSRLTTFDTPSRAKTQSSSKSRLTQFWNSLWRRFAEGMASDTEPRIQQEVDRHGYVRWHAFDPVTGRSFTGSEAELRSWIEQRYYG